MSKPNCNCDQGRLLCTCGAEQKDSGKGESVWLITSALLLVLMACYAYARSLIGLPPL